MTNIKAKPVALVAAISLSAPVAALAETYTGSSVESRLILAFKADDEAVASILPEGWAPLTFPQGPLTGTNLLLTLMDRHAILDSEGNPLPPGSGRAAAVVAYGVQPGTPPRLFVAKVFEPAPITNIYSNSLAAEITRALETRAATTGFRDVEEEWKITAEGIQVTAKLEHSGVPVGWSKGNEALPFSAAEPDFNRIYRYDQLVGLVMNTSIGREINGSVAFSISGEGLGNLFDGVTAPVAALTVPVYVRDVFLP